MKPGTTWTITGASCAALALAIVVMSGTVPYDKADSGSTVAGVDTSPPETPETQMAVSLRSVDAGPDYYGTFKNGLPTDPSYFPVGVWLESVVDRGNVEMDAAAGLNTYVELTANSDVRIVKAAGMHALPSFPHEDASGFTLSDEVDMWAGPGDGTWTGNHPGQGQVCSPEWAPCGFSIQRQRRALAPLGVMVYANYGKGVTFWESDTVAAKYVNGLQDVVSADNYWFTDPNICGQAEGGAILGYGRNLTREECRLAANYGWTVERLRKLQDTSARIPVWAFVENGHPSGDVPNTATITGPQIRAAVWSSLIHGARGIVYFNHSFGGTCVTQHVLRDCPGDARPAVTAVNRQIKELAPVLNAPFLDGAVTSTGPVDHATKLHDGKLYILSAANKHAGGQAEFHTSCGGSSAVVIDENRTLSVTDGKYTDTFADGNAVHLYRIEGGGSCGF